MNEVAAYRKLADECREIAKEYRVIARTRDSEDRRGELMDIAGEWDAVAAEHERRSNPAAEVAAQQRFFMPRGIRG